MEDALAPARWAGQVKEVPMRILLLLLALGASGSAVEDPAALAAMLVALFVAIRLGRA